MSSPNPQAFLAFILLEAITGLSLSIFTIICLSVTGTNRKRISTFSRILLALNASNLCVIVTLSTNFLLMFLWPHLYTITYIMYMISGMTLYSVTSTSWVTSALGFFYFLKIIPSQPGILTKIKNMTSTIIGGSLVGGEVVSLGGSLVSIIIVYQNSIQVNATETQRKQPAEPMTRVTFMEIVLALNSLPFFTIIVTTLVSALLLKRYNGQMKKNMGNINANVKDYRTAIQTMTALLTFYLLIFLTLTIISQNIIGDNTWGYWICQMLLFSFPTVQSALLIYGNPKLKEALRKLFTFTPPTIGSGQ